MAFTRNSTIVLCFLQLTFVLTLRIVDGSFVPSSSFANGWPSTRHVNKESQRPDQWNLPKPLADTGSESSRVRPVTTKLEVSARIQASSSNGATTSVSSTNTATKTTMSKTTKTKATTTTTIATGSYKYKDWTLTYKYKAASPGYESSPPLLLIHPVGIGLSSWFWERLMEADVAGPAMYAPNLIGCGIHERSDAWDPETQELSIPMGWVEGCEAFMEHVQKKNKNKKDTTMAIPFENPLSSWFAVNSVKPNVSQWTFVTQGGLAPIGVLLADRNPTAVKNLVLMSPPTWEEMTTSVSDEELNRSYDFYKSDVWGKLAFGILESRWAIGLFSNLFLFGTKDNEIEAEWLDKAMLECGVTSRPPIMAFNAGFCNAVSYQSQLSSTSSDKSISQPTLVLQGELDKQRHAKRVPYQVEMKECIIQTMPGRNILAWDFPKETMSAILSSKLYQSSQ